jgi:hypothetical protein
MSKYKSEESDRIVVAEILPPVISDRVLLMMNKNSPFHHRQNARVTLTMIRDELNAVLDKTAKDFVRR